MHRLIHQLQNQAGLATTALRVITGLLLLWHGLDKFDGGLEGFEGFLTFLDLPAPSLLAPLVALLEIVGGIALIVGVGTRAFAAAFAVQFLLIILWVRVNKLGDASLLLADETNGIELDLLFFAITGFFVFQGPGALSVDKALGIEPGTTTTERDRIEV